MNHNMIEETLPMRYVVKVKGKEVSVPFLNEALAAQYVQSLPRDQQLVAEIVPVTTDGKQLLLG